MANVGKYLNLMPHMSSWRVYIVGTAPVAGNEVGNLAPATFGGLSYRIIGNPSTDIYTIETESFGTVNIYAPSDNDSSITSVPQFDNASNSTGSGDYLNLQPHMTSWRVYPVGVSPVSGNEVGSLAPATFGGLSYRIIDEPSANLYTIETESFGRVNIYAPDDNDSSITASPLYLDSADGSSGAINGLYLNLMPHMTSWRVYPMGVPLVAGNEVGNLGPSMFGGLSYRILGSVGSDSYTINTESFGMVNIYAPRDADSSITSTPLFGVSGGNTAPGGGNTDPIVSNPNGVKVFLDAGHGGFDNGASGNGLLEKNVNLSIIKELGRILAQNGANVQFRRSYDTYNELNEIVNMANNSGADLFISVHCNANPSPFASGTECYTYNPSPSEAALSAEIAQSISSRMGLSNRGAKQDNFRVITYTNMPAILVETGFLTNSYDASLLSNQPEEFAAAIAAPIISRLGISPDGPELTEEEKAILIRDKRAEQINKFREVSPIFKKHVDVGEILPTVNGVQEHPVPFYYGPFKGKIIFSSALKTLGSSTAKVTVNNGKLQGELGALIKNDITENIGDFGVGLTASLEEGFATQMYAGNMQTSIGFDGDNNPVFTLVMNMPDLKLQNGSSTTLSITIELVFDPDLPAILEWVEETSKERFKSLISNPIVAESAKVLGLVIALIFLIMIVGVAGGLVAAGATLLSLLLVRIEEETA